MNKVDKPLFIFEMANNHQGDIEHGKAIINKLKDVTSDFEEMFEFAIKFQYRQLDTFIHPDYKGRNDIKNIKRFEDTRLTKEQFEEMLDEAKKNGFLTICTPFDEKSVETIIEQEYEFIKIASCSFGDWPLLEKVAEAKKPVIMSAAGANIQEIQHVMDFFKHRKITVTLMHCIAEYPTMNEDLQMNQIDLYKTLFPQDIIGFSTHESPDNMLPIRIAIAKGARVFEKHVGVETEQIKLNDYSATPEQVRRWLEVAVETYAICGIEKGRYISTEKEKSDLQALRRGVFANKVIKKGEKLQTEDLYCAFPCTLGQMVANDLSKYNVFYANNDLLPNQAIMLQDVVKSDNRATIEQALKEIIGVLKKSGVIVPVNSTCELSHHYGIEKFKEIGVAIITCVNREYCKKLLVLLPEQKHPTHYHVIKEETFNVLYGELVVKLDEKEMRINPGESSVVERYCKHSFESKTGCVFEEISTKHYADDSYYEATDFSSPRKTTVYITKEMIDRN